MFCKCGCGRETPLAKKTDTKRGVLKGKPVSYIRGHHRHVAPPTIEGIKGRCAVTDSGCWEFQGAKTSRGYGQVQVDGKHLMVHRLMYALTNAGIPSGLVVRHKCDNPPCCNPEHLEVGSHKDNSQDAISRGRFSAGSQHYNSKLTAWQVARLRESHSRSDLKALAVKFGITFDHARAVKAGRRRSTTADDDEGSRQCNKSPQ